MHQTWKNDIPELKEVETAYLHAPPSLDERNHLVTVTTTTT